MIPAEVEVESVLTEMVALRRTTFYVLEVITFLVLDLK
jgi:hypothetical protein